MAAPKRTSHDYEEMLLASAREALEIARGRAGRVVHREAEDLAELHAERLRVVVRITAAATKAFGVRSSPPRDHPRNSAMTGLTYA